MSYRPPTQHRVLIDYSLSPSNSIGGRSARQDQSVRPDCLRHFIASATCQHVHQSQSCWVLSTPSYAPLLDNVLNGGLSSHKISYSTCDCIQNSEKHTIEINNVNLLTFQNEEKMLYSPGDDRLPSVLQASQVLS